MNLKDLAEELQLTCPLVSLDLETTGDKKQRDYIVQIGIVKLRPDGTLREWETKVRPPIDIPPEMTEIHGVTNAMVVGAPTFAELAQGFLSGLAGCDFLGYNLPFDLGFIVEEAKRAGIKWEPQGRWIDSCKIFHMKKRRNLAAAVDEYLGEQYIGAHDALNDARATMRVLQGQLHRYDDLPRTVEGLHRLLFETPEGDRVDVSGRFVRRFGKVVVNFTKHAGTKLDEVDDGFLHWILKKDFPIDTQRIARNELERRKK